MENFFVNLGDGRPATIQNFFIMSRSSLESFNQILGNNLRFVLSSVQLDVNRTFLKDSAQRVLMVISYCPGRTIRVPDHYRNDRAWRTRSETTFTRDYYQEYRTKDEMSILDASGRTLLTGSGYRRSVMSFTCGEPLMTIYADTQILGTLSGELFRLNHLIAKGFLGESLFHCQKGGESSWHSQNRCCTCCTCGYTTTAISFNLISMNGVQLARIEKTEAEGSVLTLLNTQIIDVRTKVLLIFAGYYMYREHFAESRFGASGVRGQKKRIWLLIMIVILVVFLLIAIAAMTSTGPSASNTDMDYYDDYN